MDTNRLTGVTTGKILERYTFEPQKVNRLAEQGMSKEEIFAEVPKKSIVLPGETLGGFYMIYEYEVDGKSYIRCVTKPSHRKDRYLAVTERMRYVYEVRYDPANPAISVLGNRVGSSGDEKTDNSAVMSLIYGILAVITSFLVIPGIVFIVLSIINAVKAFKKDTYTPVYPVFGIVLSFSSIVMIIISLAMGIIALVAFMSSYA